MNGTPGPVPIPEAHGQIPALAGSEERVRKADGEPEGRFLSVNPAMASIFGYDSPTEKVTRVTDVSKQLFVDPNRARRILFGPGLGQRTRMQELRRGE